MGACDPETPDTTNTCTDVGSSASTNVLMNGFCTDETYAQSNITNFCNQIGGTTPPNTTPPTNSPFDEPEWGYGSQGDYDSCTYDDQQTGAACFGDGVIGRQGYCTRTLNTGDPLLCCLRDYQCNGANQLSNPSCFSDDKLNSTCNKDFRATDTPYCNFLLNQLCVGNIEGAFSKNTIQGDFTELWVNTTDDNGAAWQVTGLPEGTKYLTSENEAQNLFSECQLAPDGTPLGTTIIGGPCNLTTYKPGSIPQGPQTNLAQGTPYVFSSLPPCQQIFWRTLYGNKPTFQNNYYAPEGSGIVCPNGEEFCQETSIPPQLAACGPTPFQGSMTPSGLEQASYLLTKAFNAYISKGTNNSSFSEAINVATATDEPFLSWVFSVCSSYPQLCSGFLQDNCSNIATNEEFYSNPSLQQWCGCYLGNANVLYKKYADDYGVNKECTPYCNAGDVIPSYDESTGQIKYCQDSVCIIDGVTINLAKTRLSGGVNLNQICNGCSPSGNNGLNSNTVGITNASTITNGGLASNGIENSTEQNLRNINNTTCRCVINNFNLTTIGAAIDGGINISQACNGNATCYADTQLSQSGTTKQEVDCHTGNLNNNNVAERLALEQAKKAENTSNLWIILLFIIFVGLIIIAWLLIAPGKIVEGKAGKTITKTYEFPDPVIIPPRPEIIENKIKKYY